ncbi:MAG TPA: hypothetical protein VJR90_01075 [Gammaproteobacteria bacterium]|nr:hypothetical protein [Gammaproteobacteria bacterium]
MAKELSPYGLRPVGLIGGQTYSGATRDFRLTTNNTVGIFTGDVIQLLPGGIPTAITATPAPGAGGIVGICMGVRYTTPGMQQPMHAQYLPAGAIAAGYKDIRIIVVNDPDIQMYIQASAPIGTYPGGIYAAIGKNAAIGNFGGNLITGNSTVSLTLGANGAGLGTAATLGARILDIPEESANDAYPNLIVKFNFGVHSYYLATGV